MPEILQGVRLPFKYPLDSIQELGDSYTAALRSLQRMESRFSKDEKLKVAYVDFMKEYQDLEHMAKVDITPSLCSSRSSFFLPYHGVWKQSSTTTKLRTVFNGSSRTMVGRSLNDLQHAGSNLLPNIVDLVCRWRSYRYVFFADKIYRQILVYDDQRFQCIV